MVWIIRNGYRFFEDKSEYEVNRMFRIRGNNEAMVESGMIADGAPFPNFTRKEWDEYLATIVRYEEAVQRFELGLEEYEVSEEVYGPVEAHTVPSANKKQKVTHNPDEKQVRNPRPALSRDLNLTLFKKDFGVNRVAGGNPKKRKRYTETIAGALKELMSPAEPQPVYGPAPRPAPITEPAPVVEEEIVMNEEMNLTWDLLNAPGNRSTDEVKAQLRVWIAQSKAKDKAAEEAARVIEVHDIPDNSPEPKPSPVTIELNDSPSDPETPECTTESAEILAETSEEPVSTLPESQPEEQPETPQPKSPDDFDYLGTLTPDPDDPGEYKVRDPPVTTPSFSVTAVDPLDEPVVYMMPPKHNYPVRPNLDFVQPPSSPNLSPDLQQDPPPDPDPPNDATIAKTNKPRQESKTKKRSKGRRKKKKGDSKSIEVVVDEKIQELEKSEVAENSCRVVALSNTRNSSRLADKRISYAEPEELEDVHFWCWRCKGDVVNTCVKHGDLIPCPEVITTPGTKNPLTFPTPTFIEIRRSEIRDAGFGAFAIGFIRPGVILGEYKGKIVKRNQYLKIKESGYAWEVSNSEGIVSYIDGAGHRASNWLKFVNCCRGEIEQNTISRLNNGRIEYYTYKPIAIGHELKIYYGEKYYEDLGYDPTPDDEDKISEVFTCTECNRQWTDKEYMDSHKCLANKQQQYQCTECDKSYSHKADLATHIKSIHVGQGHQCAQCDKHFSTEQHLKRHISTIHEGVKKFSCPFCYYDTNYKHSLASHVNKHTNTKPHKCPYCLYTCGDPGALPKHVSRQHTNKKHPCRFEGCKLKCDSEEELMSHYQTHPKRQFQCTECLVSYHRKDRLTQHTAHTHADRQYSCEYCQKRCVTKSLLDDHLLSHTGVKNFACETCGKAFTLKSTLRTHMKNVRCQE